MNILEEFILMVSQKKQRNKQTKQTEQNKTRQKPLLFSFLWTTLVIKFVTVIRTTRKQKI